MDGPLLVLTVATALGAGLVAGAFFAFSNFAMAGLGRVPDPEGIRVTIASLAAAGGLIAAIAAA